VCKIAAAGGSAGLTMVQVVHLNGASELGGPHNFTEIIFIHTNSSKIETVH